MIEPGEKFVIEYEGESFAAVCLTRAQQRKVLSTLAKLSSLEESVESIAAVYDMADELLAMCFPSMSEQTKDRLSNSDIFALVGQVIAEHTIKSDTKKKSVLPRSSERVNSAETVTPSVFVTTT